MDWYSNAQVIPEFICAFCPKENNLFAHKNPSIFILIYLDSDVGIRRIQNLHSSKRTDNFLISEFQSLLGISAHTVLQETNISLSLPESNEPIIGASWLHNSSDFYNIRLVNKIFFYFISWLLCLTVRV
ncbi:hypothetical protein ACJX0J_005393, partial [Zea mays]